MSLQNMDSFRFAVVGDVHSNVLALQACLRSIYEYEATNPHVDTIVFIGDLMTYGIRANETLYELSEVASSRDVKFILGNHDQLYLDLFGNAFSAYYEKLSDWVKETVDLHLNIVDRDLFCSLPFLPHYSSFGVLFSHANFLFLGSDRPDWSYVNTAEDHFRQIEILSHYGPKLGVLGHTHRARLFSLASGSSPYSVVQLDKLYQIGKRYELVDCSCSIANAGSIGQPRDRSLPDPSWMLIEISECEPMAITFMPFVYDCDSHLNDLVRSCLSSYCVKKLASFFRYS